MCWKTCHLPTKNIKKWLYRDRSLDWGHPLFETNSICLDDHGDIRLLMNQAGIIFQHDYGKIVAEKTIIINKAMMISNCMWMLLIWFLLRFAMIMIKMMMVAVKVWSSEHARDFPDVQHRPNGGNMRHCNSKTIFNTNIVLSGFEVPQKHGYCNYIILFSPKKHFQQTWECVWNVDP